VEVEAERDAVTARTASTSLRTSAGTPTPMVSASAILVHAGRDRPPHDPHDLLGGHLALEGAAERRATVAVTRSPASSERAAVRSKDASACSTVAPWLRWENVSVVTSTMLASSTPAAIARSAPRSFRTSPM
jgi:hypothetical protein